MSRRVVPVVAGSIEQFGCIYVIVPRLERTPCLIGYCNDPDRSFRKVQAFNHVELKLERVFYLADSNLARRVVDYTFGNCVGMLNIVRGNWINGTATIGEGCIESAARTLSIPLYTEEQYRSLCRPRQQALTEAIAKRAGFR